MAFKSRNVPGQASKTAGRSVKAQTQSVVAELKQLGTNAVRDGMARYAIPADKAFGVTVGTLQKLAKRLGRNHGLAEALWQTGWYEARMLAPYIDDPALVTAAQMERWCRDFDNWAICDTACFALFDRTPFAWDKVHEWAASPAEFVKRAAFWMMSCLTVHDKAAADSQYMALLPLIEKGARDDRNFVKKAVSSALRSIGKKNKTLHAAALAKAKRLAEADDPASSWVGKDALRELIRPKVLARLG